jgi:hypothetical protein
MTERDKLADLPLLFANKMDARVSPHETPLDGLA